MKQFDVFLSHSSRDRKWASRFARSLKKEGLKVWVDDEQLIHGTNIAKSIADGLAKSKLVITIVDPESVSRPNLFFEAGMAMGLGKEVKFIVPKGELGSGHLPFNSSARRVIIRRTPAATARELLLTDPKEVRSFRTARNVVRGSYEKLMVAGKIEGQKAKRISESKPIKQQRQRTSKKR